MKLSNFLLLFASVMLMACQTNQPAQKVEEQSTTVPTAQTCYTYTKNKDTASLSLISTGAIVTGELTYRLFEKDSNTGVLKGEMRGDTLVADYTFNAEGTQSTRQVAFLKKD